MVAAAGAAVVGGDLSGEFVPGATDGAVVTEGTGEAVGDAAGVSTPAGLAEGDAFCANAFVVKMPLSKHNETIPAIRTFLITCFFLQGQVSLIEAIHLNQNSRWWFLRGLLR